ncbi:WD repeat-containing protein 75 [Ostrinia furnacalis]|uniref:WD repeat-containing protein 75 n=1 Tax=Ostrinia furnacalis TaxID=93504 RepID=UPI00103C6066|nr:WD repeat-containing protein 75 [Ostrinia furnacalis]
MGVKTFSDHNAEPKYNFHRKAGRSIIERRPLFSPDGESLAIIVENIVRVYNIQTGDIVRTLETETSVNELVGIQFPADEDYNLYSCSDCGCVTTWTWENGAVLRETKLELPSGTKVLTFDLLDSKECFITAIGGSYRKLLYLGTYSVKTGELIHEYKETKANYNDILRVSLGWCQGDRFAAIANGTKCLFIQNLSQPHIHSEILNHNKFRILAVAAHSSENAVAIVDTIGRVTVIRGNLYDHTKIAREVMHWHFLPPLAVCFSKQGSYLYTGGMEKVLVKWTIGNLINKANEKMFIPRLPGMVRYIAVNDTHAAITLTNNSVVIASVQMRVVSTILECGGLSPFARAIGTSLLYHRSLGALLMGGRTGHLQLLSTTTDKVLYNVDITMMNSIPPARRNLLPLETEVTCAAISGDGKWLVTSEYRNDGLMYPEEMLKFWHIQKNNPTSPFRLNTCVNLSHGGCNVVALALNKSGDFCISAGTDQKFRIWKKETQGKASWSCQTACYYSSGIAQFLASNVLNSFKNGEEYTPGEIVQFPYLTENSKNDVIKKLYNMHKEQSLFDAELFDSNMKKNGDFDMGGVAISQDGSLIAAWFGCKLTLWDTHLCSLRTTLSHPALRPKGVHVLFGNQDAAHYLVCTTEKCLAVWSLLSLTVKWLVQLNPTYLAADPFSNKMAITTSSNDIYVFTPHNSKPILTRKSLLNPKTGVFKLCTFGATSIHNITLYVMRNDSEVYCLEPEDKEESRLEVMTRRSLPASTFSTLLAEQQLSDVRAAAPVDSQPLDLNTGHEALSQLLIASPHMCPPVSLLCTSFLQSLSGQEQPEESTEDQDEKMDVESNSSDDEDAPKLNGPYAPKVTQLWTPNYEGVKEKRLKKIVKEPFLDLHTTEAMFGV